MASTYEIRFGQLSLHTKYRHLRLSLVRLGFTKSTSHGERGGGDGDLGGSREYYTLLKIIWRTAGSQVGVFDVE